MKRGGADLRTWGFIAGGAALLAVLTLVLCILGGVFDFKPKNTPEPLTTPVMNTPPTVATPPPAETSGPIATPPSTPKPTENWLSVSVIAGAGGTISPSGLVTVSPGESLTLYISPDPGYELVELKADGKTVETAASYTFSDIEENHSLYAIFRKIPEQTPTPPPPTDTPIPPTSGTDVR